MRPGRAITDWPDDVAEAADQVPGITRGMRWQNQVGFRLGARWPVLARALMRPMQRNISSRPERTIDALARAMSPADAQIVRRPEVRPRR